MPGPAPKDPRLRQRRNKPSTSADLPKGAKALKHDAKGNPKRPALPNRGPGKAWHKSAKEWWERLWQSPMASRFLESDVDDLIALAELVELRNTLPAAERLRLKIDAEIRMQSRRFGLAPMDRRSLGWTEMGDDEEPADEPEPEPEHDAEDPRKVLRMVRNG